MAEDELAKQILDEAIRQIKKDADKIADFVEEFSTACLNGTRVRGFTVNQTVAALAGLVFLCFRVLAQMGIDFNPELDLDVTEEVLSELFIAYLDEFRRFEKFGGDMHGHKTCLH